jgi:hypothetical protein
MLVMTAGSCEDAMKLEIVQNEIVQNERTKKIVYRPLLIVHCMCLKTFVLTSDFACLQEERDRVLRYVSQDWCPPLQW